jgi:hypothetical protein
MFDEKNYRVIICTLVFLINKGRARVGYKGRWRPISFDEKSIGKLKKYRNFCFQI